MGENRENDQKNRGKSEFLHSQYTLHLPPTRRGVRLARCLVDAWLMLTHGLPDLFTMHTLYNNLLSTLGVPGVKAERYQEAMNVQHCALSLVGTLQHGVF